MGQHQLHRRPQRRCGPGTRRRVVHRHLPSALLRLDDRVEPGPGGRADLSARGGRRLGHAAASRHRFLARRHPRAGAGPHADPLRRPLPRRHRAALGRRSPGQGCAADRRCDPGGAGPQDGELHVQLSELHPAEPAHGAADRGGGRTVRVRSDLWGVVWPEHPQGCQAGPPFLGRPLPRSRHSADGAIDGGDPHSPSISAGHARRGSGSNGRPSRPRHRSRAERFGRSTAPAASRSSASASGSPARAGSRSPSRRRSGTPTSPARAD